MLRQPSAPIGRHLAAGLFACVALMPLAPPAGAVLPRADLVVDRESVGGPCSDDRSPREVTEVLPLCSLDAAVRIAPEDGTVLVRRGTYPDLAVKGEHGRQGPVTFRPAPGEQATLQGLRTEDAAHLRFEGFRITDQVLLDRSRRIQLVGNDISPRGVSLRPGSREVLIERNRIHDLVYLPRQFNGGYGVLMQGGEGPIRDVIVRGNRITGTPVDGIQVTSVENLLIEENEISHIRKAPGTGSHTDAIQLLGGHGITIRSNFIHDTSHGLMNTDVTVTGLAVVNNLFARVESGYATQLNHAPGATMVNNTYWETRYGVILRQDSFDLTVMNNIFDRLAVGRSRVRYEDHNLIAAGDSHGANDIKGKPQFVNPQALDYRLRQNSPGIDRGRSDDAPGFDLFGRARVGRTDMGAVEYLGDRGFGLRLRRRRGAQRFRARRGVLVELSSPVSCTVNATARVRLGRRRVVSLRPRKVSLLAGQTAAVVLRPKSRRSGRAIRRALARRRALRASVLAVGTDRAGDSQTVRRRLRLRR